MKSYSNVGLKPRSAIPTINRATLENVKNGPLKKHPYLQKIRFTPTPSSQSSSKDTQPNSEQSFSQDTSSSDNSKLNAPSSLSSLRNLTPQSNRSDKNFSNKISSKTVIKASRENIPSFQSIQSNDEAYQKISPPSISAKCWAVMDGKTGDLLYSKLENRKREIASLTKMMNLFCVVKLLKDYDIDPKDTHVKVSKTAASMKGTSATLKTGDIISIWDLLHGLMLPSGNDAATTLAENFGTLIYLRSNEYKLKCLETNTKTSEVKNPAKYFIKMMNDVANDLGLYFTQYVNPHGLSNTNNFSTVGDQAKLSYHLLKLDVVREIVNTVNYTCEIEQACGRVRVVTWENTNKLLKRDGWGGVKTGITPSAGPCLSAYYEDRDHSYIVILLNSSSMDIRWIEAPKIVEWAMKNRAYFKIL